jgi:hypothetical protein
MPNRSSKKRLDVNQLAARIVAESTGQAEKTLPPDAGKRQSRAAKPGKKKRSKGRAK